MVAIAFILHYECKYNHRRSDSWDKEHGGKPALADDLLSGVSEIAEFIGEDERRTYHLIHTKQLPAFKWGGKHCSTKSKICERVNELLARGAA